MSDARAIAEETARASYGRLLAWLSSRTHDVAAAEDALSDAFRAALETWPQKGVPAAPEAWLLTAARRKLIDASRRKKTRSDATPALSLAVEEADAAMQDETAFPDERLKLLFICAHPAIEESIRTPLMLQTVLGLDAARIASAFLLSPAAMNGRLVRAKRKIKAAAIPFATPDLSDLPARLSAVLSAIYAAFGTGWNEADGADAGAKELTHEAIYLAKLVTSLLPEESEAWGLLSLMQHAEARRAARRANGAYVALKDQDAKLWDHGLIAAAEEALARAWSYGKIGPYQLEAAIQSAHAASILHRRDTRADIVTFYAQLTKLAPSSGAYVGYAAALTALERTSDALAILETIDEGHAERYQPYWAVKAHIFSIIGKTEDAITCYNRAIGLTADSGVRNFLVERKNVVGAG